MPYRAALDWLSFFLADVRGGLGPYVGIFLLTEAHWDQAMIGGVLTISGLLGISLHTPVGALIDATRRKRELIIAGVVLLALSAVAIERMPIWPVVLTADIAMAVLGALFAPTLAAITLGLVRSHDLAPASGAMPCSIGRAICSWPELPAWSAGGCRSAPCFIWCRCSRL
jgi:predicted MFS family arabinose efflux permease